MNREVHVRVCEGLGVRFPQATRLARIEGGPICVLSITYHKVGSFSDLSLGHKISSHGRICAILYGI